MSEIPSEFTSQMADLNSHRIEGIAAANSKYFSASIVSQIEGNLWMGGHPFSTLPGYFKYVLNLYPWETLYTEPTTEVKEVRLYDSSDVPDPKQLMELASWVNEKRKLGPTLVKCQAGLNRSGLITALALIISGMTPDDAIKLLREKRSQSVLCNSSFEKWLRTQPESEGVNGN